MTQYKLTKETQTYDGHTLYRIELTEDCKWGKKGDKGGWVESKANLQEDAWVSGDAWVYENAKVCGNAWVGGYAKIFWNAQVYGNAHVYGDAQVYGYARVCGYADVYGDAKVRGDAQVLNSSKITGGEWSTSPLQIQGSRHFFNVSSPTTIHVGCQEFNISTWQNEIEKVGRDYNYTDSQIKEYIEYFNLVEKLKNISLPIKTKSMYTGQLEGFPQEIVEKMLDEQVRQGNKRDVTVFEKNIFASKRNNGFDHETAVFENWYKVKEHRDFDLFYAKYPKKDKTFEDIAKLVNRPVTSIKIVK